MGWTGLNLLETLGSYLLTAGLLLMTVNLVVSRFRGAPAGNDPWEGDTLEWSISSPPPAYNFAVIPTVASRYPLWEDRLTGHEGRSSTGEGMLLDNGRETIGTSALDAVPDVILRMPGDSFAPLLLSLALAISFVGMLIHSWWLFGIAIACSTVAAIAWLWPEAKLGQTMDIARGSR
jgi:cytochrome c oxidase subunit 1/cytochrome c oxidase subunit I+III